MIKLTPLINTNTLKTHYYALAVAKGDDNVLRAIGFVKIPYDSNDKKTSYLLDEKTRFKNVDFDITKQKNVKVINFFKDYNIGPNTTLLHTNVEEKEFMSTNIDVLDDYYEDIMKARLKVSVTTLFAAIGINAYDHISRSIIFSNLNDVKQAASTALALELKLQDKNEVYKRQDKEQDIMEKRMLHNDKLKSYK